MMRRLSITAAGLVLAAPWPEPAHAGVVNPDISVIGQPFARWTDDPGDAAARRATLDVGETEFVFDAYLNPYARGTFTVALGEEGAEVEEGYFLLTRGLPGGLALKGGRYRAGFGRLNIVHPHAYPFAERFHTLAAYLPGEEAFIETGAQLSMLVPVGSAALTLSADWLQGDSFRLERGSSGAPNDPLEIDPEVGDRAGEPRPATLGRVAAFFPLGQGASGLELGVSGAGGTGNVAAGARTTLLGADAKAKLWHGARAYLVLQGEWLRLERDETQWDEAAAAYSTAAVKPQGGYVFADYNFDRRYNVGASFERWQQPTADRTCDRGFGLFAGLALLEESTAFRIGWERLQPGRPGGATETPDAIQSITVRVIYSMGPHKAHQF
jgi:hypothetical protein